MGAIRVGTGRLTVYVVLGTLLLASIAANFVLYSVRSHYVVGRPVDRSTLYETAQLGIVRGYLEESPVEKIQQLQAKLSSDLVLGAISSTKEKIEVLGIYLYNIIRPHDGLPSPSPETLSGSEIVDQVMAGRIDIWPDGIARLYVTMANAVGIPSRLVRVHDPNRGVSHWIAESYLSEQNHWAAVDLRYRQFYTQDLRGMVLNSADLLDAVNQGELDELEVALFEGGAVVRRPLLDHASSDRYYFRAGTALEFPLPNELAPSVMGIVASYLYAPRDVYALQWQPFIRWGWVKMGLLSLTLLLSCTLFFMALRDLLFSRRKGVY